MFLELAGIRLVAHLILDFAIGCDSDIIHLLRASLGWRDSAVDWLQAPASRMIAFSGRTLHSMALLGGCEGITHLGITQGLTEGVAVLIAKCSSLEVLVIDQCPETQGRLIRGRRGDRGFGSRSSSVHDASDMVPVTDATVSAMGKSICGTLCRLTLNHFPGRQTDFMFSLFAFSSFGSLTYLDLSRTAVSVRDLGVVCAPLLQELTLDRCPNLGRGSFNRVSRFSELVHLSFRENLCCDHPGVLASLSSLATIAIDRCLCDFRGAPPALVLGLDPPPHCASPPSSENHESLWVPSPTPYSVDEFSRIASLQKFSCGDLMDTASDPAAIMRKLRLLILGTSNLTVLECAFRGLGSLVDFDRVMFAAQEKNVTLVVGPARLTVHGS